MRLWYVARTKPAAESKAAQNLLRQKFDVYLPRYRRRRKHARRFEDVSAPLFPRYIFVSFDIARESWRAIDSTIGVAGLVRGGADGLPLAVPDKVVSEIRAREDERGHVQLSMAFKQGEKVRVVEGPFADAVGIFDCTDDKKRAVILLRLLGKEARIRLLRDSIVAV
jgi:transcriptional antiterminator RfaH